MLGFLVSLTEQSIAENKRLIKQMSTAGSRYVFTSLQMPEEKDRDLTAVIKELGDCMKEQQLQWIADVSPATFERYTEADLASWGFTGLRIDDGVTMRQIAGMTQRWQIILNASTLTAADLAELTAEQAVFENLSAWYNYYPRPETGLAREAVRAHTRFIKSHGLTTGAFIQGDGQQRGPIFAGLPTLEAHRDLHPLAQYFDLLDIGIDTVLIGDLSLAESTLVQFKKWFNERIIQLHVTVLENTVDWLSPVYQVRRDVARDVIRAANSRIEFSNHYHPIAPANCQERLRGSVTIDNAAYLRYEGELQIILGDLLADEKVNVVGRVVMEEHVLLRYVNKPNSRFTCVVR